MMPRTRHADEIQAQLEREREKVRVLREAILNFREEVGTAYFPEALSQALATTEPEAGEDV